MLKCLFLVFLSFNTILLAEPFKVGVIVPLTGPLAEYGVAIKNGIELAKKQKNISNCKFVYEDSIYQPSKAISAFQKLTSDQQMGLIYAFGGPIGEALTAVAEQRKFPFITDSIDPKVSEGRKYSLRYGSTGLELGGSLALHLNKLGAKKVVIISTENQYINQLIQGFEKKSAGLFELKNIAKINPDETDLRAIATKVLNEKFDSLGIFLLPGQISTFSRLVADRLPKGVFIFGGDFFESPVEIISTA